MQTVTMVEQWIYGSFMAARPHVRETLDAFVRRPEWTRFLLNQLNSPDQSAVNVAVTGSKGKGSTSVMLAAILRAHGYRVGLFTSPHLVHFSERMRVNGVNIADASLVRFANKVREVADPLQRKLYADEYISPIGLAAIIAALYFQEQRTHINIWECGRGARYDDVNQVVHQAAVITPIMTEHTHQLGSRLEDVAEHKLGVITPTVRTVCIGRQHERVLQRIQRCERQWPGRQIACLGRDFRVTNVRLHEEKTQFSVHTPHAYFKNLRVPLLGAFQADNAAVALAASEQIIHLWHDLKLNKATVHDTFNHIQWPGRLEWLSREPVVIVDGAIHRQSAQQIVDALRHLHKMTGILIVGIPQDKDYAGVIQVLAPLARLVIVTSAKRDDSNIAMDAANVAKQFCTHVQFKRQSADAFHTGLTEMTADEWLLIVGTQSLVGEAHTFFKER